MIKWNHDSLFTFSEAYLLGQELAEQIGERVIGRIAGYPPDHGVLAQMLHNAGDGDHLEIGTLFGGSAILAALIKERYDLDGVVVCVDPMTGYYGKPDPFTGEMASQDVFYENVARFDLSDRIKLIVSTSSDLTLSKRRNFASTFIDGAHDYNRVLADWNLIKWHTDRYVLFDNYDRAFAGVRAAVRIAIEEPEWRPVLIYGISALFEREN